MLLGFLPVEAACFSLTTKLMLMHFELFEELRSDEIYLLESANVSLGSFWSPRAVLYPEPHETARETSRFASEQFSVLNPGCSQVFARLCGGAPPSPDCV